MICTGTDKQAAESLRELQGEGDLLMYRLHGLWYVGTEEEIEPLITESVIDMRLMMVWTHDARGFSV